VHDAEQVLRPAKALLILIKFKLCNLLSFFEIEKYCLVF
jgi:hypothetical protein